MTEHLMAVAIGPVQGFVSAARRTRDLWMGSVVVSECSKAVARRAASTFGLEALIFPAPASVEDLEPINFDTAHTQVQGFDVPNIVLFVFKGLKQPAEFADTLREEAWARWDTFATLATAQCSNELRKDWQYQLKDNPIEFYAAWFPYTDDYAKARSGVMRLLAGRKACRTFDRWPGQPGLPKSSLDGARETILREAKNRRRRGLRARPKEELDLIGVVKRAHWGHNAIRYPSVSRVAVDPWVRGMVERATGSPAVREHFGALQDECLNLNFRQRKVKNADFVEDDIAKFPWLKHFRFEGTPIFASRHSELVEELLERWPLLEGEEDDWEAAKEQLHEGLAPLRTHLAALARLTGISEPWAYLAVLAADGDGMGRVLSEIAAQPNSRTMHRTFSETQSTFAKDARGLINGEKHSGACVFASADDVLAFVPVDRCLGLARELRDTFDRTVGECSRGFGICHPPTLSVGLAIGHFMEPLEDLLSFAREAEARAKNPDPEDEGQRSRDGLAIAVHARSGAPFVIRDNWQQGSGAITFDQRIADWARLHQSGAVPAKAAYDLVALARHHQHSPVEALQADAHRVLARKRRQSGQKADTRLARDLLRQVTSASGLLRLAHEMLAGQWVGNASRQAAAAWQPTGQEEASS